MNKKNVQVVTEILKYWYFIDSVLLNDHAKNVIVKESDYNEYVSLKAAVLSDLYEFYNYIGYSPKNSKIPSDTKTLQEQAVQMAKKSKSVSATMLECKDMKSHLKKVIMNEFTQTKKDVNKISDTVINERFIKMSLDNMLIGVPILECKNKTNVSDFKGGMLEQAYLTMRSEMVKIAKEYNHNLKKNLINEALADVGFVNLDGFSIPGAQAAVIKRIEDASLKKCNMLPDNSPAKKTCSIKCKVATQQKIIMALRSAAAKSVNKEAKLKFSKDIKRAQERLIQYQKQMMNAPKVPMVQKIPKGTAISGI
jgi:hypothetical protein